MPCVSFGKWKLCIGNPTEKVTMRSGRVLKLEWHNYFGPSVEARRGTRPLTSAEFHDPNVDAWIVSHGGMSCLEDDGPIVRDSDELPDDGEAP